MGKNKIEQLIKDHVGVLEPECRWCFAVDMQRIEGKAIATYNYPDSTLVHLSCPRCGGEFTLYIQAWDEPYLEDRILTLHPELEDKITDDLIGEVNDRMWPEYEGCRV